ncbi:MAG: potassium transporter TrkG [Candidatus Bathyarchaeia archaeon]
MIGIVILLILVLISLFSARKRILKRYLYYSRLEPVLANLGFLLQISGLFTIPSIIYAYHLDELGAAVGLFIGALVFICLGLPLTIFFEPKMLDLKQSCLLIVLYYIFVPLINCIPYLYLGIFSESLFDQFINSWFETTSASSTTGLSLLEGMDRSIIPKSLTLARGISEWVGGIGIVFILTSLLYPSRFLHHYGKVLGIEEIAGDYKRSFMVVFLIYLIYTLVFSAFLFLLGLDVFTAFHTVFTVLSTTGFMIVNALSLPAPAIVVITILMIFSALSFSFHLKLISLILKEKWRIFISFRRALKGLLSIEIKIYFVLLLLFTFVFWLATGLNPLRAFFHMADFLSSVGLNVMNFEEIGEVGKVILVVVMFIGSCSFSCGGGVRVLRLYILGKILLALPRIFLTGEIPEINVEEKPLEKSEILMHLATIFIFMLISFIAALILCNYGYSFVDALIESVSAITTTGDSPKVLSPSLPILPKLLLIALMFMGRIEILPLIVAFSRTKVPKTI